MLINLKPLFKYRDYRLLFLGQLVSWFGNMLTYVALPYQIFHLTHSSLAVGNVGLVQLIPLLVTSLWGGALADKLDRRKLLLNTEVGLILTSGLLLWNSTLSHPHLWVIYFSAALASGLSGFHRPTIEAMTQSLVSHEDMIAVSSLATFKFSLVMIAAPALAGLMLAKWNISIVYFIDFLTYFVSFAAVFCIQSRIILEKNELSIVSSIKEGIRYAAGRQELIGTYVIDFVAMVFGMPMALFPAIAHGFHSVVAIGWLYAAPSVGGLIATGLSGWAEKIHRHGAAVSISALIWGIAIILFGMTGNIYMAIIFLAIAGAADGLSGLFRMTMWNQTIPKNLRGRLASIEMISYMSGPLLGNAEAGIVAAGFGVTASVVSGGVMCVFSVVILTMMLPKFWKYSVAHSK